MNTKTNIKDFDIEERVKLAVQNFESGFNCAQSVFLAYSDVFDLDLEMAKNMTVSFGGGVGRMREICGSISAMAMLAGFKYPVIDPLDQDARTRNYAMVQKMTEIFRSRNNAIICRDLKLAVQNFESGFNCAQSVFLAYADVFDLDLEMAKNLTVSFDGGLS